ncbi:hypothetical protein ADEAN_000883100 [Angomonas deanei]|uniref:Uncharacterized protein n=1 Tax=Angomonas deanei TaxID=59799 RepID=A0A7G2CPL5_9TRYP|nr:hypothetical protein ADEAN_000883100 [Angomonas deanei]
MDPKVLVNSFLPQAPNFILTRFPSVLLGVIAAYSFLLFFLSGLNFLSTIGNILVVNAVGYGGARGLRWLIARMTVQSSTTNANNNNNNTSTTSKNSETVYKTKKE